MNKLPIIGITVGDINGIGPEIVIKALADQRILDFCIPVVYGSPKLISYWKKAIGLVDFNLHLIKSLDQIHTKRPNLLVCWEEDVEIKPGDDNEIGGKYALKSLEMAAKDVKEGKIHALVTAPLNKHNVNSSLLPFKGHTEYLAQIDGTNNYMMMLVAEKMKVGLVTGHIPLKDVASKISEELIVQKIKALQNSLQKDFSLTKPRIAVLGLNPHAGDNGLLGNEDKDIIAKACKSCQEQGILAYGPYPADGFFGNKSYLKFDAVLAMYHDQGLIPFKFMGFENGVNFTAGLSFIRTSPDHGTAYDIAGKNRADESSLREALYMSIDLVRTRNENFKLTENFLPFTQHKKERFRIDF